MLDQFETKKPKEMLISIAWKNIWRNKTRSLLIMGSIVMGIWIGTFMLAYAFGMIDQRLQDAVKNEISHLQIHHPLFGKDYEVKFYIANCQSLLDEILKDTKVESATSRVVVNGMVSSPTSSEGIKIIGVQPALEDVVTGLKEKLIEGDYLIDTIKNRVIIGKKLAEKLKVKLRSKIVLTMQDSTGNILSGAFRISGIYETYNSGYDQLNVFVNGKDLGRILHMENEYHEIAILMKDPETLKDYLIQLSNSRPDILVESWATVSPELGLMVDSFDQYMVIFLIIILLALSFGIINTMLMVVLERVREIGMLMAIGMNRASLFAMIALESIILVLTATPLGLMLGYALNTYLGKVGMDLSGMYDEGYAAFGYKSFIYPKIEDIYYLRITVMVVITAIVSSLYPAWTAIRLNPIKAIRKI